MANFWTSQGNQVLEPKRSNRFLLVITPQGSTKTIQSYVVKSSDKPKPKIESATHNYLGHEFKFPGSVKWEDISVTLVDPADDSSAETVATILEVAGYSPMVNQYDVKVISKKRGVRALGAVSLRQIDADGNVLEEWVLNNGWISGIDFGSLSYDDDKLIELKVTLSYDWASLKIYKDGKVVKTFYDLGSVDSTV